MSADELVVLWMFVALTIVGWWKWYAPMAFVRRLRAATIGRWIFALAPLLVLGVAFLILRNQASFDVQSSSTYLSFYLVVAAGWIGVGARCFPLFGLHPRDDVLERDNDAAAIAVGGALLGVALAFSGGNVGDGPGWWVVVFSSGLATGGLFAWWHVLERLTHIGELVTIDRDLSAGLRLAALLTSAGLIMGRAVSGDWVSAAATVGDFVRLAWPALLLWLVAAPVERVARPTTAAPSPSLLFHGLFPAVGYVGLAVVHVARLGPAQ